MTGQSYIILWFNFNFGAKKKKNLTRVFESNSQAPWTNPNYHIKIFELFNDLDIECWPSFCFGQQNLNVNIVDCMRAPF